MRRADPATAHVLLAPPTKARPMVLQVNAGKSQTELLADLHARRDDYKRLLREADSAARRDDLRGIVDRIEYDIRNLDADILSRQVG